MFNENWQSLAEFFKSIHDDPRWREGYLPEVPKCPACGSDKDWIFVENGPMRCKCGVGTLLFMAVYSSKSILIITAMESGGLEDE